MNVSVKWQLVFMFLPIVSLWAYYRIKKLQSGILLSLGLVAIFYGGVIGSVVLGMGVEELTGNDDSLPSAMLLVFPLMGLIIYLKFKYMIKWTREWNLKNE